MKKIFLVFAAVCAFAACDPVHENISNDDHITVDELRAKTSVTVDKAPSGLNGNVITCTTSAPVSAKWDVGGKEFVGNYAWKKMKLGEHTVTLTALCPDGTVLTTDYSVNCEEITNELTKYWIYGEDPTVQPPFKPAAWDGAEMRFSDNEGKHLPYLSDDIYFGLKELIFNISDATPDCAFMVHNGWWSATYIESTPVTNGLWTLQITEQIAKDCARGGGGAGKDLQLLLRSGSCTINSVYYEE